MTRGLKSSLLRMLRRFTWCREIILYIQPRDPGLRSRSLENIDISSIDYKQCRLDGLGHFSQLGDHLEEQRGSIFCPNIQACALASMCRTRGLGRVVRRAEQFHGRNGALDVFGNDLSTPIILEFVRSLGGAKLVGRWTKRRSSRKILNLIVRDALSGQFALSSDQLMEEKRFRRNPFVRARRPGRSEEPYRHGLNSPLSCHGIPSRSTIVNHIVTQELESLPLVSSAL